MVLAKSERRNLNRDTILDVRNLTKVFGSGRNATVAVDNISFSIKRGEVISLLGESGSGKTTTARMLLKLMQPTSGTILFSGRDITSLKGRQESKKYWTHVQAVFQDPFSSFNSFYSVRTFLGNAFRLLPHQPSAQEKEAMIQECMKNVGLNADELLDKRPHELSGGQRQRIMIARVLLINPDVLIADEPTSMIDASSRAGILNLLLNLRETMGMTIMFITHDIGLAYYTSDRLLIMSQGKIVEQGDADEVITNPKDEYTKRLMNDVPVLERQWDL
ncbi:MAG: ABC transporter ATP-binding protein [Firmicutes bacterium]|nr:ABC transporter ATP-binding protein [Bacillota bacterium]